MTDFLLFVVFVAIIYLLTEVLRLKMFPNPPHHKDPKQGFEEPKTPLRVWVDAVRNEGYTEKVIWKGRRAFRVIEGGKSEKNSSDS